MSEFVREIRELVEALNKTTPLAVAALALMLAISVMWMTGGHK
ncbi:hypothetical protein [Methylococcus sp. EFPC2]|nr:hypothetical protein [Methylococcus sp. EFPC2]